MSTAIVRIVSELRSIVAAWRREGLRIAVVPTMGALHEGHLSLVRAALANADRVIVTLFINPRQFNNPDDLAAYPRTEHDDTAKLASVGAHILYAPDAADIYPPGFATTVSVSGVSEGLCGTFRPGHFDGVATVVTKLLLQTGADLAFFGEKDFQQLHVVRQLVRDLDVPIEIIAGPTVREADGLAMSSRNARLSLAERNRAPRLAEILVQTARQLSSGESVERALTDGREAILAAGFSKVEYLELRADGDLASIVRFDRPARLLVAAWLGQTRLIDNVEVALPRPEAVHQAACLNREDVAELQGHKNGAQRRPDRAGCILSSVFSIHECDLSKFFMSSMSVRRFDRGAAIASRCDLIVA